MPKVAICIDVPDQDKAVAFYTQALDCEFIKRSKEHSELSANGTTIYLGEKPSGSNPLLQGEAVRDYQRHWTPIHLDFIVTNLEECVAKVLEHGGVKEGEKSGDWGAIAFCSDPFGNGFCVMQYAS
ncbi:MAG: VOC family protein [Spirochaetota bacterium]